MMKHASLAVSKRYISSSHNSVSEIPPFFPLNISDYLTDTTSTSLSSALQYYISSTNPSQGQKIHSHIIKSGFKPNTNISIKILILFMKSNCLNYARKVFDEMPQPTLSAYNYMLNGYVKDGQVKELVGLVQKMVLSSEKPDGFTLSMILKSLRCSGEIHAKIFRLDVEADDVLYTALVDSYVRNGRVGYARRVFDTMVEKNVICSTSMISGYMNIGNFKEAEDVFRRTCKKDTVVFNAMIEGYSKSIDMAKKSLEVYIDMQRCGYRPTISTFSSIIGACSILSAFEIGQQVQCQLTKTVWFMDIKMGSALVDMYSKCGRIEDARGVFDHMHEKNVFSWTSMIDGYGKNGLPNEALELFGKMQEHSVEPNYVTYLGALSACGHAGLVNRGKEIFESMEKNYKVKPRMEHYACMVDLLGRSGNLNEAWEFVRGMPEKPNSDVWAALLSACMMHDAVEMANIAANELFKLGVEHRPGAYVAFSNTLAAAGKWERVGELRESMKDKGISKNTGFSWVGTDTGLEGFHAVQKM